jgi:hypothetical protein
MLYFPAVFYLSHNASSKLYYYLKKKSKELIKLEQKV